MRHLKAALIAVLAFSALVLQVGGQGAATQPPTAQRMSGSLQQNRPNPFNPETTIPFSIGFEGNPPVCREPERQHRVTLRVHDLLGRIEAIPIMKGGGEHGGAPVDRLLLRCGNYEAYWDGTIMDTGRKVSSGVHHAILEVDGQRAIRRMLVGK
jgi:hypothetical protein